MATISFFAAITTNANKSGVGLLDPSAFEILWVDGSCKEAISRID